MFSVGLYFLHHNLVLQVSFIIGLFQDCELTQSQKLAEGRLNIYKCYLDHIFK